jgi:glycerol-3-phosphate dehydrogenase
MAVEFLNTEMGRRANVATKDVTTSNYSLSKEEKEIYTKRFQTLDQEKKGYISINDLRRGLQVKYEHQKSLNLHI